MIQRECFSPLSLFIRLHSHQTPAPEHQSHSIYLSLYKSIWAARNQDGFVVDTVFSWRSQLHSLIIYWLAGCRSNRSELDLCPGFVEESSIIVVICRCLTLQQCQILQILSVFKDRLINNFSFYRQSHCFSCTGDFSDFGPCYLHNLYYTLYICIFGL